MTFPIFSVDFRGVQIPFKIALDEHYMEERDLQEEGATWQEETYFSQVSRPMRYSRGALRPYESLSEFSHTPSVLPSSSFTTQQLSSSAHEYQEPSSVSDILSARGSSPTSMEIN